MDLGFAAVPEADGDWGDEDVQEPDTLPTGEAKSAHAVQSSDLQQRAPPAASPAAQAALEDLPHHSAPLGPGAGGEAHVISASPQEAAVSNGSGYPPSSKIHNNPRTRYFVIKSNNHKNLVLSVENNVWATQRHNEPILNEAFTNAPHVVLIFSVNLSGCFQGYAKMVSPVGSSKKTSVFQGFGRAFDVRWLRLDDLDFNEVAGISNPLNENKSVKMSRDGQELPNNVGRKVCEMVDHRVYRADPGNYITDEKEVETGGFGPPLLSHSPPEALQPSMRQLAEPMTAHPLSQPRPGAYGAPGAMLPPGAVPPQPGVPPAVPLGPDGYPHPPGAHAWNPWAYHSGWPPYHHWGPSSESSYSSSSYSSYSYSDSEDEAAAAAQLPVPIAPQPVQSAGSTSLASPAGPGMLLSREHVPKVLPAHQGPPQPRPLPAVAQPPAPLPVAAAPVAQPAREHTRVKEEKAAKEVKKTKQAKEAKAPKDGKGIAKQPKEAKESKDSKEQKTPKEGKTEKGKEKKSDRKEKCEAEKRAAKKSSRESGVAERDTHVRRSSRAEASDGRKDKRQRVELKQEDAADGHKEKRRKVVLKEAKDVEREGRHRERERTSRDRRRRSDRHSDPTPQQPSGAAARPGASPPDSWRGAHPPGRPPSHWPPLPGYAAPPLHSHLGLPPPRPLQPPIAGAPDWRSHAAPRGAPPLDWRGACPVRS